MERLGGRFSNLLGRHGPPLCYVGAAMRRSGSGSRYGEAPVQGKGRFVPMLNGAVSAASLDSPALQIIFQRGVKLSAVKSSIVESCEHEGMGPSQNRAPRVVAEGTPHPEFPIPQLKSLNGPGVSPQLELRHRMGRGQAGSTCTPLSIHLRGSFVSTSNLIHNRSMWAGRVGNATLETACHILMQCGPVYRTAEASGTLFFRRALHRDFVVLRTYDTSVLCLSG